MSSTRRPLLPIADGGGRGVSSPFSATAPSIGAALAFAVVAAAYLVAGASLPGGRWLAVHLFTLGVLTNVVWVFSRHFGARLTGDASPDSRRGWTVAALNLGVLATLWGTAGGVRPPLVAGAVTVTAVVAAAWIRLRRQRHAAPDARFGWVVRIYERAHGAFLYAAVLGALLGIGVLPSGWYLAARDAHLHLAVLGWGGLTLLATLVFFGPALLRARMEPGADTRAARALRVGATGLSVAAVALLLTGAGGPLVPGLRMVAAGGLGALLWASLEVVLPLGRVAARSKPYAARGPILGVIVWLPVALTVDVLAVATGQRRWLEVAGVLLLVGVLAQAVLAVLAFLMPNLRARGFAAREALSATAERGAGIRAFVLNTGVALVAIAAALGPAAGPEGAFVVRVGWSAVAFGVLTSLVVILRPRIRDDDVGGVVARRGDG